MRVARMDSDVRRLDFVHGLERHGSKPAMVFPEGPEWTYGALARDVRKAAEVLEGPRSLVVVRVDAGADSIVAYLATLAAGHAAVLVARDASEALDSVVERYRPAMVVEPGRRESSGDIGLAVQCEGAGPAVHPDLALCLSTSGSTGSSKLVRLSYENLNANAASIADYLHITSADRAATTLPLHYCYGLSVVHSYLRQGASLLVTANSVVDPCFWRDAERCRITSFAGVPYTFELLDQVDFAGRDLPSLRYITQAGGRMPPERVARYAALGEAKGWQLVVMYGATEATARMAYLPPEFAATHPGAIGVPIPGGSFRIQALDQTRGDDEADEGELIYRGPNVMLGYAERAEDLAVGRTVDELATGDIARCSDGLYQIVGRKSRFLKLFGLRVDLDRVEQGLAAAGIEAACAGDDDLLVVGTTAAASAIQLADRVRAIVPLPPHVIEVVKVTEIPRLTSGKVDYVTLRDRALAAVRSRSSPADPPSRRRRVHWPWTRRRESVHDVFTRVLGRPEVAMDDTFVSLGGDSLCYVELSTALEDALGSVPANWHQMTIAELQGSVTAPPRSWAMMPTDVVLRNVAIVLVVAAHVEVLSLRGAAHALLIVSGYNFARFSLAALEQGAGATTLLRTIARIVIPTWAWTLTAGLVVNQYLFVTGYRGTAGSDDFVYWFLEVLVHTLLVLLVLFSIPPVRRWIVADPYLAGWVAFVVPFAVMLAVDRVYTPIHPEDVTHRTIWMFGLGWLLQRSTSWPRRAVAAVAGVGALAVVLPTAGHVIVTSTGLLVLAFLPGVPVPRALRGAVAAIAGASLYIYLTHFKAADLTAHFPPIVQLVAALIAGVAAWWVVTRAWSYATQRWGRGERPALNAQLT
jgi:acyl-coenzyme A synthetase/AMP-(fatty) acid ligase